MVSTGRVFAQCSIRALQSRGPLNDVVNNIGRNFTQILFKHSNIVPENIVFVNSERGCFGRFFLVVNYASKLRIVFKS